MQYNLHRYDDQRANKMRSVCQWAQSNYHFSSFEQKQGKFKMSVLLEQKWNERTHTQELCGFSGGIFVLYLSLDVFALACVWKWQNINFLAGITHFSLSLLRCSEIRKNFCPSNVHCRRWHCSFIGSNKN